MYTDKRARVSAAGTRDQTSYEYLNAVLRTFVRIVSYISPVVADREVNARLFLALVWWRLL